MSVLSVPINSNLEEFVDDMVKSGQASNKADVVRKALLRLKEEEAINSVLKGLREGKEGKNLRGNIDELAKIYS